MASYHKRKRSPYFWISVKKEGKQTWVNSKLTHEQEDKVIELCRELSRLELTQTKSSPISVNEWAEKWFEDRGNKILSMKDDKSRITKHVLPHIGTLELKQVRKADVQKVFDHLRSQYEASGKPASGTIKSIYAACKVMFSDAVAADLIPASPLHLTSHTLPSVHKKPRLPYTITEIEQILSATPKQIPDDRRTLYAVLFFFGLRFGEGAALRWSDLDFVRTPLAGMHVEKSYSVSRKKIGRTKTETKRWAPIHPILFFVLQEWRDIGFPKLFGRFPEADDLLVPSRENKCRSSNHGMKRLRQDFQRLGLPHLEQRTQHAFRTAFISQMRAADVDKDKLRAVTHGKRSSGDVIDAFYTVWPWEVLCKAVLSMQFSDEFLHSIETAVSMRNQSEKWRGGRDSKSAEERYRTLLTAKLQRNGAPEARTDIASVNSNFTQPPTILSEGFTHNLHLPEPLTVAEVLAGMSQRAYPLVDTFCADCKRELSYELAPSYQCIYCGSYGVVALSDAVLLERRLKRGVLSLDNEGDAKCEKQQ